MRVLAWHGWLLDGTGSNVYTAKVAEVWRRSGHDVFLMCQERHVDRFAFVDAVATASADGVSDVQPTGVPPSRGSVTVIRPDIGALLPVFVFDEYEGFEPKRFVDLDDDELAGYLERNVSALAQVAARFRPDAVVVGHAVPGPAIARRALGPGGYVAKVHGSDLEYAIRLQTRYGDLAREGLEAARAISGASHDVLRRAVELVPAVADRIHVIPPGVDVDRWRPRERGEALRELSASLAADPDLGRGRPDEADRELARLLDARDAGGLDSLARTYDQRVPDPASPARLAELAERDRPIAGYLGKLIPQKGVERLIQALALDPARSDALIVGFGLFREWLAALVVALDRGDVAATEWLASASPMDLELRPDDVERSRGAMDGVVFTGRLDHRYAPSAVAAMEVLVVPSTLEEAFGMVAAEAAATGALPVVARHSALAEVAEALELAVGRPGFLSFEPGPGATARLGDRLSTLLSLPREERAAYRRAVRAHVEREWTWERTAERLLAAAT